MFMMFSPTYQNTTQRHNPEDIDLTQISLLSPVILYECEVWSFTLREEHEVRLFEN